MVYTNDYLENAEVIGVVASTTDASTSSEANITAATVAPKITFYKKDPGLGVLWQSALSDTHAISGEEIIVAAPYYISPSDIRIPDLVFRWSINGLSTDLPSWSKNVLPVKVSPGTSGVSSVRLDIESKSRIYESASREINVQF